MTRRGSPDLDRLLAELVAEIRELPEGSRAPGEAAVMERFGLSRVRARTLIGMLEQSHLVTRRQGSGTYVNHPLDYRVSTAQPASLHATVEEAGGTVRTVVVERGTTALQDPIAARLDLPVGTDVPHFRRIGYVNGRVATALDEYLSTPGQELVGVALGVIESVEEILRGYGHEPFRSWFRGTCALPPTDVAEALGLPPATLVWKVESILGDRGDGRPLVATVNWSRMDVLRMVFEMDTQTVADAVEAGDRPAGPDPDR